MNQMGPRTSFSVGKGYPAPVRKSNNDWTRCISSCWSSQDDGALETQCHPAGFPSWKVPPALKLGHPGPCNISPADLRRSHVLQRTQIFNTFRNFELFCRFLSMCWVCHLHLYGCSSFRSRISWQQPNNNNANLSGGSKSLTSTTEQLFTGNKSPCVGSKRTHCSNVNPWWFFSLMNSSKLMKQTSHWPLLDPCRNSGWGSILGSRKESVPAESWSLLTLISSDVFFGRPARNGSVKNKVLHGPIMSCPIFLSYIHVGPLCRWMCWFQ